MLDAKQPVILERRMPITQGLTTLGALSELVQTVGLETYAPMPALARQRLVCRDEDDWHIQAAALALSCPIWTENTDFFGFGVAIWTTERYHQPGNDGWLRCRCQRPASY